MGEVVVAGLLSYGVTVAVLLVAAPLYMRFGVVSRPRRDRWGRRVVPLCGGIGLICGLACGLLFAPVGKSFALVGVAVALFLLGTVDDKGGLNPTKKLVTSFVVVTPLIAAGIYVNILFPYLGVPLSVLWFAGMAHAMNLLDNMDGIACGVGAVVAGGMAYTAAKVGDLSGGVMAAALCGACSGVLLFNFPPARLFLGDAGSLPLGAALAALSVWATWREASGLLVAVLFPLLVLFVPLMDTLFVVATRRLRGRHAFTGGRDHLAHRLAAAGLTDRRVFALFITAAAISTTAAIISRHHLYLMLIAFFVLTVGGALFGLVLSRFGPGAPRLRRIIASRATLIVAVADAPLFAVAFLLAYLVRFGSAALELYQQTLTLVLPVVVAAKVGAFFLSDAYEDVWSLRRLARCSVLASLAAAASLGLAVQFRNISRLALAADLIFSFSLSAAVRLLLRRFVHAD